jgi:hypothetical protein
MSYGRGGAGNIAQFQTTQDPTESTTGGTELHDLNSTGAKQKSAPQQAGNNGTRADPEGYASSGRGYV